MIGIAKEKRETKTAGIRHRTQFHVDDATIMDYPESFYDLVYSRCSTTLAWYKEIKDSHIR